MFGGIKATFLTDYVHTVILLIILLTFAFTTYASGTALGSTEAVYKALNKLSDEMPVPGNAGGSYLTMKSKDGAIFFVINIIGNFGTVFMDNGCKFAWKEIFQARSNMLQTTTRQLLLRPFTPFPVTSSEDFPGSPSHGCAPPPWVSPPCRCRALPASRPTRIS